MIFVDNSELYIESDTQPDVSARVILPETGKLEREYIKQKPFINNVNINFTIIYYGKDYSLFIPKGYTWDGATIPFGFRWMLGGKGNPAFLVASCLHDKMCEEKWLVDNDRHLSSLIFRELLKACGCGALKAQVMYLAVDNFQKLCNWRK